MALRVGLKGPFQMSSLRRELFASSRVRMDPRAEGHFEKEWSSVHSLRDEQLSQNWYGQGESDCLIKTKHCDGRNQC